jgi:integrase
VLSNSYFIREIRVFFYQAGVDKSFGRPNLCPLLVASVAQLVEQLTLNQLVLGSSPSRGTTFTEETEECCQSDTIQTQVSGPSEDRKVKFPKIITHRKLEATIYRKTKSYPFYRVAHRVDGKRRLSSFATYSEAKTAADKMLRALAKGSRAAALTSKQAADALAALEVVQTFYEATGRRLSLHGAVTTLTDTYSKLKEKPLSEAIDGFLNTVATVKRLDIGQAVIQFIESRKTLAEAKEGKRAQLSPVYAYNVAMWLREFAGTFKATAVCDLSKEHLNTYLQAHSDVSAKSRNDRRAVVRMFLAWCMRQDYLSRTHRLFEADGMTRELVDRGEIEFYRPAELRTMLERAEEETDYKDLLPMLALGGLAGLRVEECLRLEWSDVWRTPGHVEITARKAKGRRRRLVEMVSLAGQDKDGKEYKLPPTLMEWLAPFQKSTGLVWGKSSDAFHETFTRLRDSLKIPARRNGLRHAFCTYHFALHSNENLTAAQAGNSPAMIHEHYKGLTTAAEARKWFGVKPLRAANVVQLPAEANA